TRSSWADAAVATARITNSHASSPDPFGPAWSAYFDIHRVRDGDWSAIGRVHVRTEVAGRRRHAEGGAPLDRLGRHSCRVPDEIDLAVVKRAGFDPHRQRVVNGAGERVADAGMVRAAGGGNRWR